MYSWEKKGVNTRCKLRAKKRPSFENLSFRIMNGMTIKDVHVITGIQINDNSFKLILLTFLINEEIKKINKHSEQVKAAVIDESNLRQ